MFSRPCFPEPGNGLRDLTFEERPSLVCELKHPNVIVHADVLVRNETLHELRERLMPSLIKDEAMGVEIPHGDRAALLRYELQQALSGCLDAGPHCVHFFLTGCLDSNSPLRLGSKLLVLRNDSANAAVFSSSQTPPDEPTQEK